jgi:hypothetical protein
VRKRHNDWIDASDKNAHQEQMGAAELCSPKLPNLLMKTKDVVGCPQSPRLLAYILISGRNRDQWTWS